MKIFAPANNKGGVGKTSTSALYAEYASKILNKRVLGIDLDPQCNFSQRYLTMEVDPVAPEGWIPPLHPDYDKNDQQENGWDGRSSIAGIFYGEGVVPYPTEIKNFDMMPAHAHKLLNAEAVRRSEVVEKVHQRLREFLALDEVRASYDLVVIDTAPSKGPLTISAIKAATHMIIPSVMEDKPIQGIYGMLQLWMQESLSRDANFKLELVGILPNMFNSKTNLHNDMYNGLLQNEAIGKHLMESKLGQRVIFAETDCHNAKPQSIFDLSNTNLAKKEAIAVCEEITRRVF